MKKNPKPIYFKIQRDNWIVIPLLFLLIVCIYLLISANPSWQDLVMSLLSIYSPSFPLFFVATFIILYIYTAIKNSKIPKLPRIAAYLFSGIFLFSAGIFLIGIGQTCIGLFGVQSSCTSVNLLALSLLLLNPVAAWIWATLAVSGSTSLVLSLLHGRNKGTHR